jgi:hypothetical protein
MGLGIKSLCQIEIVDTLVMRLQRKGWYDYDDPEHLIWFEIHDDCGKMVWDSWHDIRDVPIAELRQEILDACVQFGLTVDLSAEDYFGWAE